MKSLRFLLANILFYLARFSSCAGELSQIRKIMWHEAWSECRQFTSVFHPVRMVGGVYKDVYIHNRSVAWLSRFCLRNVNLRFFFSMERISPRPLGGVRS